MILRYTALDWVGIAVLATGTAVQFLRGIRDFSRVFYETVLLVLAVWGVNSVHRSVAGLLKLDPLLTYVGLFLLAFAAALLLALLLNGALCFGLGAFNYLLALVAGLVSAYAVGHVFFRVLLNFLGRSDPGFVQQVARSWVARELLFFRTWVEVLALLRQVRWLNV